MNQRLYFYHREQLALEIKGTNSLALVRGAGLPLAERRSDNLGAETRLLMTDVQKSLLQVYIGEAQTVYAYTAYGHDSRTEPTAPRMGFNGEHREHLTGAYLLGQGYRAYNSILTRFQAPDSLSPFGDGGVNAYGYCGGDPVNYSDPTGHVTVAELTARMKAMNLPVPSEVASTTSPLFNKRPARTLNQSLSTKSPGERRTKRRVSFLDATEVNTFHKDEAPILIPKPLHSPIEIFRQRRINTIQAGKVFGQLRELERHYAGALAYSGRSLQARRPAGKLNAQKLRLIGNHIAYRRQQLFDLRDAADRLRSKIPEASTR